MALERNSNSQARDAMLRIVHIAIVGIIGLTGATTSARAGSGQCYVDIETRIAVCQAQDSVSVVPANQSSAQQGHEPQSEPSTNRAEPSIDQASERTDAPAPTPQNQGLAPGECAWKVVNPSPEPGDPRWEGHSPADGVVLYNDCNGPTFYQFAAAAPGAAPVVPPPPPPDPAVLAQQARGQLDLPQPTITRSPDANNSDPALGGAPYTWVQLWTWVWTLPQSWAPKSVTVTAGGVSVTATGTPVSLVFDPGDGGDPVSCAGPGRPWTVRDGNDPPTRGGCGYVYRHVTPRGPLTSTVSIRWSVAWTSNTGAGGTLPELVTQASSSFYVQQIQVVIR